MYIKYQLLQQSLKFLLLVWQIYDPAEKLSGTVQLVGGACGTLSLSLAQLLVM